MNGSRLNQNPRGERSLDALNKTIDNLEARIEGLLKASGREPRIDKDLLNEIRQRQRSLGNERPNERGERTRDQRGDQPAHEQPRQRQDERDQQRRQETARSEESLRQEQRAPAHRAAHASLQENRNVYLPPSDRPAPRPSMQAQRQPEAPAMRSPARHLDERASERDYREPQAYREAPSEQRHREPRRTEERRSEAHHPEEHRRHRTAAAPEYSVGDLVGALQMLRQDLKQDISEGISREMEHVRHEIHAIRDLSADRRLPDELRSELARLAQIVEDMHHQAPEGSQRLQGELYELRAMMDGLAREESVHRMEVRWNELEDRIQDIDTQGIQKELIALAYRIDGIKAELGTMSDSPALRALEDKVLMLAAVIEDLGTRSPLPDTVYDHFSQVDQRLDEISRAVASNSRVRDSAEEQAAFRRLEERMSYLTEKFESLSQVQETQRIEEKLEEVVASLGRNNQTELTGYLADLSRRIDAMHEQPADQLVARLDDLAARIDHLHRAQSGNRSLLNDGSSIDRLEQRLDEIAERLSETARSPAGDMRGLSHLEKQIADLTSMMQRAPREQAGLPADLDQRMASIENYLATSDEYILEAARQAAETVVEAYRKTPAGTTAGGTGSDPAQFLGLAEDLRHLEQLARASDERTQTTFDSLHRTLVQIAGRLDKMEDHFSSRAASSYSSPGAFEPQSAIRAPMAAPSPVEPEPRVLARNTEELMRETAPVYHEPETDDLLEPVETDGKAKGKSGFLSSLSKRLKPASKTESKRSAQPERTFVEPAPSIDPVDVVPQEHENDLLEPGSGKPDVRKILERVRASQAVNTASSGGDNERIDYIAAARRAAKAAAQETDPAKAGQSRAKPAQTARSKSAVPTSAASGGLRSTFTRHRRPILMAIGAVLLVLMTVPLINTLTRGDKVITPPPPVTKTTPSAQMSLPPATSSTVASSESGASAGNVVDGTALQQNAQKPLPPVTEPAPALAQAAPTTPVEAVPASPMTQTAPAAKPTALIEVPAVIAQKSLADAAAAGDPQALFEIAARYTEGRNGVPQDPKEAARWYQMAAERGFAPAEYRLGSLYEKGTGVERDLAKAMSLYQKAANAGNASSMHNLAVLYASGATGTADYKAAVNWFTKAADLGIADSQFNLAILFARGNGTSQNLEESYKWFAVAAKAGDKDAADKREEVGRALKPDQLAKAKAAADSWTVKPLDQRANSVNIPTEWSGGAQTSTGSIDMGKAIRNIQAILNKNGYDAGQPDGLMGKKTIAAIKSFQKSNGMSDDGNITEELVRKLLEQHQAKVSGSTG
ncbi:hypothetical protein ASD54_10875 [Rhizobium sp. Root149]|uniref:peptidoglycan-binding protein n=1 Tax=Rhizobium sp. Root149 TaxID=1736473 RepID=UPI0007131D18|nr:peptidoglycan-binding protein [Rhizobium sp. Root149]KQZ50705.1 hypothetical protein ASD54_10875 [Rhizobium sp. Root149]